MKPEHIAVLESLLVEARARCDDDVTGCRYGTMCACAFLQSAIARLKKGYQWK